MLLLILAIFLIQTLGLAVPDVNPNTTAIINNVTTIAPSLPTRQLFQFEQLGTWIENVAARANGDLLFTMVQPAPRLYLLSAVQSEEPRATLLHEFPDMTGLTGITEIAPDVFVVVGGKFHSTATPIFGTFSLWQVSLAAAGPCPCGVGSGSRQSPVTKLLDLPDHVFPNGLVSVPDRPGVILVANSMGSLLRVDLTSGKVDTVAAVPEMAPVPGALYALGINGVKIHDGHVYWTNSFAATMYRMPLDAAGFAAGIAPSTSNGNDKNNNGAAATTNTNTTVVETVAFLPWTFMDDFAMAADGTLWITTNPNNTVVAVNQATGKSAVMAGGQHQEVVAGALAATFGRTDADRQVLYVVTDGGNTNPVNGTFTEPAKIVAIDTTSAQTLGF